jgi:hypothetical protein
MHSIYYFQDLQYLVVDSPEKVDQVNKLFKDMLDCKAKADKALHGLSLTDFVKKTNEEIKGKSLSKSRVSNETSKILSILKIAMPVTLLISLGILKTYLSTAIFVALYVPLVPIILIWGVCCFCYDKTLDNVLAREQATNEWLKENADKVLDIRLWTGNSNVICGYNLKKIFESEDKIGLTDIRALLQDAETFRAQFDKIQKENDSEMKFLWDQSISEPGYKI